MTSTRAAAATPTLTALAQSNYRPDIDGLRAVAVLSVVVFHLKRQWLPGGFVGVDIFFVISGYLITRLLHNDFDVGGPSYARFYQRRIARIFPAFFAVAIATIMASGFVSLPQDFASAGANLVAASLSVLNLKQLLQGSYFEASPDAQPLLHYWSLSVEEQYYIVYPALLFFLFRHIRRYVSTVLVVIGAASFLLWLFLADSRPVWAFYLLPTRAWELCAGCLVAVSRVGKQDGDLLPKWLPYAGVLLVGLSLLVIHEGPAFPGWVAIVPVCGAVALIVSGGIMHGWIIRWLSSRAMVAVGRLSYSIYLCHWPVFSLIDYGLYLHSNAFRLSIKLLLTAFFAVLSFRFIEQPARIFLSKTTSRSFAYAGLAIALALCVSLGILIRHNNYVNADLTDVSNGGLVFRGKPGAPTVVLMGDSNGSMYGKVLKAICSDLGETLVVISTAAGDPLPAAPGEPAELWERSLSVIRKTKPDYLVFASDWMGKLHADRKRLVDAIEAIEPYVGHIILLNQPPILPETASRAAIRNGTHPVFRESEESNSQRRRINEFLHNLQSTKITVLDVSLRFETSDGGVRFVDEQGRQLYQDAGHISGYGADRIRDLLEKAVGAP